MLNFLFPRLTADGPSAAPLFDAVTAEAREPHWYVEGKIPDTLDGRFAMLATILALVLVRFERDGEAGNRASVALTERFITVMEAEHRELGLGDPALGKTVRKLVGSLSRRVDIWRSATDGSGKWEEAARASAYKGDVAADALLHTANALEGLWDRIEAAKLDRLMDGRL